MYSTYGGRRVKYGKAKAQPAGCKAASLFSLHTPLKYSGSPPDEF